MLRPLAVPFILLLQMLDVRAEQPRFFPARVLKSPGRPLQLLDGSEFETRVRDWLQSGKLTEAACGQWGFTWTAIKIECDPQSVLEMLEPFDLRLGDLREGALHNEPGARGSAPLRTDSPGGSGATYATELDIDPDAARRQHAQADVALAEMMRKAPLTLEAALRARANDRISGTIATTLETDSAGRVMRRQRVMRVEIATQAGSLEPETTTDIVERRLISRDEQRP